MDHSVNPEPEVHLPAVTVADVVAFIRRSLPNIFLTCLVTLGLAVLYLIAVVPKFVAEGALVIESKGVNGRCCVRLNDRG